MFKNIFFILLALVITACGGNNDSNNTTKPVSKVDSFVSVLKQQIYVRDAKVVITTDQTKNKVFTVIEVYSSDDSTFGEYAIYNYAFDLSLYEIGDSYGDYIYKYKDKYIPESSSYFDLPTVRERDGEMYVSIFRVDEFLLDETEPSTKDLEKIGAFKEEFERAHISENLSAEFGLSEERSQKISRLVQNWSKVSDKRKMTSSDANLFVNEIIGTNIEDAEKAYKKHIEGNSNSFDNLIERAASANEISPEHMSELVNELLIDK